MRPGLTAGALGHSDGLAPSITDRLPGVVAQRVHAAAGTCITDEHKARGLQRAGATQRGATTSVCASLFHLVCVFITAGPITKLCAWGRRIVEDMCYEIRRAEACVD